jgi:uncharacterized protein YodC (DUF2158 family)
MFQIGDAVQLKTGGPMMTVEYAGNRGDGNFIVLCTWFNDRGEFKRKAFAPEILMAASASPDLH